MNLKEQIYRMKSIMGLKERVDIDNDSYITMNIKNFPKYKEELTNILRPKLESSNGDFVMFKNSVVKGKDENGTPILADDLNIDNRFVNYMVSMGLRKFNSLLHDIFSKFYNRSTEDNKNTSEIVNCDPSNFEILGPITAKDNKSLLSYWINEPGAKVYRIKLPDECSSQLTVEERKIYVTVEPRENRVHFPKGVPERLRGKKLGTLIYLAMIKKLGYITSSMGNSPEIKMVYQDLLSNEKYANDIMSLLLQKQVLIFDKNANLDFKKIFNEFVSNKFTDKSFVRISPALQEILGEDYTNWYNSLETTSEESISSKIEKYKDLEPKGGDTVVDTRTNKIYSFNGEWEQDGGKKMSLVSDKYESLLLPVKEKSNFKVIHRAFD